VSKKTRKYASSELSLAKEVDTSSITLKKHLLYNPIVHMSLIILLGLLAYSNTFHASFVFDDTNNIVENYLIKDISNIPSSFINIGDAPISARPLTAATFALNYYLGGLNTTGYHIVNLLLHVANGILLYFLIMITAGYLDHTDKKKTGLVALFSSLIFIVHPVQTESVTYIVSRSVLLSTFFFLLGIILFTKAVGTEGKRKILYITALFITSLLGIASREEFFIFPVMLILYDLYFISKQDIKEVLRNYKIHLLVISTLGYVLYIVLSHNYGEHAGFGVKSFTPLEYLMTQFNVHWTYIRLLFLPISQNLDYDYPIAKTLFELPTFISFIGYTGLWGTGIYLYRKKPVISFCILWFVIALFPTSGFMPIIDVIFEHRLYLPSMGAFIALTSAVFLSTYRNSYSLIRMVFIPLLTSIVIVFAIATYTRNVVWQDDLSLWQDTMKKSPEKARPYFGLGVAYNNLGNIHSDERNLDLALQMYQTALNLKPDYAEAYYNIGNIHSDGRNLDLALQMYQTALNLKPDYAEAYYNIGTVYEKQGRLDDAMNSYIRAVSINPDMSKSYHNIGYLKYKNGNYEEAIQYFKKAVKKDSRYGRAFNMLGLSYTETEQYDLALENFDKAIALEPGLHLAHNNKGIVHAMKEEYQNAIIEFSNAVQINPSYVEGYDNRGMAYLKINQKELAVKDFQEACRLGFKKACGRL
jgi:tetratricopeptide (TPR) repeat protein